MKINSLHSFIVGGLLAGASLGLASCDGPFNKVTKYMREHNYTQQEYEELLYKNLQYPKHQQTMIMQSALDSMVYRDLFNSTHLAKDSVAVAEFNALAGRTNIGRITDNNHSNSTLLSNILKNEGVTIAEYESATSPESLEPVQQHLADKLLYSRFFKKYGLTSKDFQAKFDSVSKIAKPYNN